MNLVKLTVAWVSEKNPKFAILAEIKSTKFGSKVIISRGQGGFLEADSAWTKGETVELPADSFRFTTRKTSQGTELPVIELV